MGIALAVTDSPVLRRSLDAASLAIDYVETTGPLAEEAVAHFAGQTLLLHNSVWNTSLAHPTAFSRRDIVELTCRLLRSTGAPFLSAHLGFAAANIDYTDRGMQALSPVLARDELFDRICTSIRRFAARLPVPLILENLDLGPSDAYRTICQPDFIAAVLHETDSGFLLDLAHAQVTATRLGMSIDDYLAVLPMERVRQVHVSGPRQKRDGTLYDAHDTLCDRDDDLLRRTLTTAHPDVITLEYHQDPTALLQQVRRLGAMIDS